ncbi:unnamed protein product, partial [Mesorhabditis belari]|uniref:Abnormal cell migration protein 18-like fibronectin type I domain-containing protein n=1 Tax=Mesorhabditis belari TaxID=2138241 RepID=A0AAF3EC11_9BILA
MIALIFLVIISIVAGESCYSNENQRWYRDGETFRTSDFKYYCTRGNLQIKACILPDANDLAIGKRGSARGVSYRCVDYFNGEIRLERERDQQSYDPYRNTNDRRVTSRYDPHRAPNDRRDDRHRQYNPYESPSQERSGGPIEIEYDRSGSKSGGYGSSYGNHCTDKKGYRRNAGEKWFENSNLQMICRDGQTKLYSCVAKSSSGDVEVFPNQNVVRGITRHICEILPTGVYRYRTTHYSNEN